MQDSSFYGFGAKTCTRVIGWFEIAKNGVGVIASLVIIFCYLYGFGAPGKNSIAIWTAMVMSCASLPLTVVGIVSAVLHLVGSYKKNPQLITYWIVSDGIAAIGYTLIVLFPIQFVRTYNEKCIVMVFSVVPFGILWTFMHIVLIHKRDIEMYNLQLSSYSLQLTGVDDNINNNSTIISPDMLESVSEHS